MPKSSTSEVSQLLQAWNDGDETALEKLMPLVYKELHRIARHYMARESPGHTLQTTALVNEAYVRLVDSAHSNFQSRIHFLAVCAQAMRRILVDWGRSRRALKRGGKTPLFRLDETLGEETAEVLKVSSDTVMRDWKMARAWLHRALSDE